MKQTVETFHKDKNGFMLCVAICSTIWFLAVCILFGVYIYCSFNSSNISATQYQDGDYTKQGVAGGSISIN